MIEAINAGVDDYITKSSDFAVLKARLGAQLRRKQFEDENSQIRERLLRKELEASEARAARELAETRVTLLADLERQHAELQRSKAQEHEAHEALKRTQSHLVQSEKLAALGQMVAGVAHEINNPLAFVINNVVVLDRDVQALGELLTLYRENDARLAREAPELFGRIRALSDRIDVGYTVDNLGQLLTRAREGLRRIERIVLDLRGFARLDQGERQLADLNAGVQSTINIARGRALKKMLSLEAELGTLPLVTCHLAKINQVILNLIADAIDACPEGGRGHGPHPGGQRSRRDRGPGHGGRGRSGDPRARLRSLLHDQAGGRGDGARPQHQLRDRSGARRTDRARLAAG
jgi:signal transduction histidine kinase